MVSLIDTTRMWQSLIVLQEQQPYSPWERSSDENQNGLIREFMSKVKSMRDYGDHYTNQVQDTLNHRLRKSLNYLSAGEAF